ncbi:RPM1 interacting protein 4 [Euphorbia peplus]|nr:RPM1 interacting protein 4 [Euphorbia peplus]
MSMAEGSSVPKFGNWETGGDNVPYTVSFEKARKTRSKIKIKSIQSQHNSQSEKLPESPITVAAESPFHRLSSGDKNRRGIRRNGTSDFSIDSKFGSKGNGVSPVYSLERKGSTGGGVPMTPGRSRLRSSSRTAIDDSQQVDESTAVPKFGAWDENNPGSGDGYTVIFNKVKEERHGGGGSSKPSHLSNQNSKSNSQKHYTNHNSKAVSCFCWG